MQRLSGAVLQLLEQTWIPVAITYLQKLDKNYNNKKKERKMVHFMQLDDRWPIHLLTTLRALLGAAASFLFGQPKFFYLGQHLSFVLIGQISQAKWLKEQTPFIVFWTYCVVLDFWHTLKQKWKGNLVINRSVSLCSVWLPKRILQEHCNTFDLLT